MKDVKQSDTDDNINDSDDDKIEDTELELMTGKMVVIAFGLGWGCSN